VGVHFVDSVDIGEGRDWPVGGERPPELARSCSPSP